MDRVAAVHGVQLCRGAGGDRRGSSSDFRTDRSLAVHLTGRVLRTVLAAARGVAHCGAAAEVSCGRSDTLAGGSEEEN